MTIDILNIAVWGEPRKVNTKNGPMILRQAPVSATFRTLWRSNKAEMKAAGLGWDVQSNFERVNLWQADTKAAQVQQTAIDASKATDATVNVPIPEGLALLGYQKAGIAFAMAREATLIGDEMGLGKTIQALGVINADASIKRVLIVCPASLKLNWKREASKWLTRPLSIGIVNGCDWPNAEIVICNYDVAAKNHKQIHAINWDLAIFDEAHYCKNPKAQRTVALLGKWDKNPANIRPAVRATRRIVLTGTPILNRPIEAQPILGFLSPKDFGNFWAFAKRYAGAFQGSFGWDLSGASNLDELQRRLRSTVMVRRLKADVLTELPPKRRQILELPANGVADLIRREQEEHSKHEGLLADLRASLEIAKLLDDSEAYQEAVEALRKGTTAAFESMALVRHDIALAKVPYVVEHVSNTSEPVVVFAHHRDVVAALVKGLTEAGKSCVQVIGGMTDEAKQASVDAFQSGKANVFVGNIKAAGVGLTLTKSSHVVFAELDWVPANVSQAEDRTHRIGQTESVLIQHLVLEGSLDQVMAKALVRKQAIADKALDKPLKRLELDEPITTIAVKEKTAGEASKAQEKASKGYTQEEIAVMLAKLRFLVSVCDGAIEVDGSGFNKFDARFGRELAACATLSPKQAEAASRLVTKYRKQLTRFA